MSKYRRIGILTGSFFWCLPRLEASRMGSTMALMFKSLRDWVGETLSHALGNPSEEKKTVPPAIGFQPYRDVPEEVIALSGDRLKQSALGLWS